MHTQSTLVSFLLSALLASRVHAGSLSKGDPCSVAENRLQVGTYQFYSECDSHTYCNGTSNTCELRRCRSDIFPFGYSLDDYIPDMCQPGEFCPDEMDACQPVLAVGSPCQLNRDDQCEPPADWRTLRDTSGRGLNVNGSVCLNYTCMWANVTVGQACVVENTAYIAYGVDNKEFIDVVSRGNCQNGLYCDAQQKLCMTMKAEGVACTADKECSTFNCLASGKCGKGDDKSNKVGAWVYVLVVLAIIGGAIGTLVGLYFIHRRERDSEREKRQQYWREQNAFRQNIMQMRDAARTSVLSMMQQGSSSPRSTLYSREGAGSEDSQLPIMHSTNKSSGLRNAYSDDGQYSDEGGVMMEHRDNKF